MGSYSGTMAYHGPSYGLSRECHMKSQAKFSVERARECMEWVEEVLGRKMEPEACEIKDQIEFSNILKDGAVLCQLINAMNAPFKQREDIEMYLKACIAYGLKEQDLFQVNDVDENKSLDRRVDNIDNIGGMTQKKGWSGPVLGVK